MAVDAVQMPPSEALRLELTPVEPFGTQQKQVWNLSPALSDRCSKGCSRYAAPVSIVRLLVPFVFAHQRIL